MRKAWLFWLCLCAAVLVSRLMQAHVLWADEDYHLASAIQVLWGKIPYRDFWYDKPPLNLLFYLLLGARTGIILRVADAAFVILCCALAYKLAAALWSRREGFLAAGALAFFSIFYLAPGVIPEEPDTLMLAPHLAAVYFAVRKRPLLAGLCAGLAFQLSVKGALVLISAALFTETLFTGSAALAALLIGFLLPNVAVAAWLAVTGSVAPYLEQVWRWGLLDAGSPRPGLGLAAVLGWFGFHAALLIAAIWLWARPGKPEVLRTLAWASVSLAGAAIGLRFAPRYFMLLLPAVAIPAARGFTQAPRALRLLIAAALLVPAIRFSHISPADTAMDRESFAAARIIQAQARPGDTIFVWGYRPDVVAYTRLPAGARIWDSQPLTGVPADRHLSDDHSVDPGWAAGNRAEIVSSRPVFLVDGLSLYNPSLDIHRYPELADWLAHYCPAGRSGLTIIYRLCPEIAPAH